MNSNYHLDNVYFSNPIDYNEIYLLQIGRLHCKNTTVIDTHIHTDLFELTVVTGGAGTVITNGVSSEVHTGDIYLSMPCDVHAIVSDREKPLKYDFFAFRVKDSGFQKELDRIAGDYHSPNARIFHDERIRPLIGNAIAELASPNRYSSELLGAIFRQILIYLVRGFQQAPASHDPDNATHAEILCYRLMNYIDTHIYSMKNLSELCEATDYSYGYLSALFKKTTSETLSDYYNRKRTDAARLLLAENKLTITEISEALGYASLYSFSKAFRNQFGLSPKIYRKRFAADNKNAFSARVQTKA